MVVLGAQVQGDQPSLTLKKRLDLALSYLNDHPQAKVIVLSLIHISRFRFQSVHTTLN